MSFATKSLEKEDKTLTVVPPHHFPQDTFDWILENYADYHLQHVLALMRGVQASNGASKSDTKLDALLDQIVRCYSSDSSTSRILRV